MAAEHGVEGGEVGVDVREDRDAHRGQGSAAAPAAGREFTRRVVGAPRGRAGTAASMGPRRGRRPAGAPRGPGRRPRGPSRGRPGAPPGPAAAAASSSSSGPRFQATRTPPGATSGSAELHELREARHRARGDHRPAPPGRGCRAPASRRGRPPRPPVPSRPVAATTVRRNATFLATESTSRTRSGASAAASGRPGKPPPLPRSRIPVAPRGASRDTAARLSRTWSRATPAGSRIAVRLIAAVQASSRRTWPSMASRAAGPAPARGPRARRRGCRRTRRAGAGVR